MSYFPPSFGLFEGVIRNIINNNRTDVVNIQASLMTLNQYSHLKIIDFNTNHYWVSEDNDEFGQWISIELTDRWVSLTHYAFQSTTGYAKSWDFEVSADGIDWFIVHSERNSDILNQPTIFPVTKYVCRFFRITNRGNSNNINYPKRFRVQAIDLYGAVTHCDTTCSSIPPFRDIPFLFRTCNDLYKVISSIQTLIFILFPNSQFNES